ncbi:beta-galactosidase 11-like isoform X2 [Euphorbia lathyris]
MELQPSGISSVFFSRLVPIFEFGDFFPIPSSNRVACKFFFQALYGRVAQIELKLRPLSRSKVSVVELTDFIYAAQMAKAFDAQEEKARVYEQPEGCAACLTKDDTRKPTTASFRGKEYLLPPCSINILPDCQTVVFNTMRNFVRSEKANKKLKWEMAAEMVPSNLEVSSKQPKELLGLTKDTMPGTQH